MEKFSSVEKVVGAMSEERREKFFSVYEKRFDEQDMGTLGIEGFEPNERPKTPEEIEAFTFADQLIDDIRVAYGLDPFPISHEKIHIMREETYPKNLPVGLYSQASQTIVLLEAPALISQVAIAAHELVHMKSYNVAQLTNAPKPELTEYRMGLGARPRDGASKEGEPIIFFNDLNEALTEETVIRIFNSLRTLPSIQQDIDQSKQVIETHKDGLARYIPTDTIHVSANKKEIFISRFGRQKERTVLTLLIDAIYASNKDTFADKEEVFNMFQKAMFTGNMLELGKIIDHSFGKGTLRKIAELNGDLDAQASLIKSLGTM